VPEFGQVRHVADSTYLYVRRWNGLVLYHGWIDIRRMGGLTQACLAELRELPQGTVIDWQSLPAVIVLVAGGEEPAPQIDDDTFAALLAEAEATGVRLEGDDA
jgi:hypothetical protein